MIISDKQCSEYRAMHLSFNDMVRKIFSDGMYHGNADIAKGAIGAALLNLESAVRADRVGCLFVIDDRGPNGEWARKSYLTTQKALSRLDALRNAMAAAQNPNHETSA
jgi:hypothetical protein